MSQLTPEREAEIRKLWPRMVGTWGAQAFPDLLREIDALRAERVSAEELVKLVAKWRKQAKKSLYINTWMLEECADELEAALRPTHTPESGENTK